ncbi:MAG: DUF2007 domain-containing protein [Desulfobacteraceae bacterium]|nr:DUF2007 domain-containing protein [Desulfobacteraceae bacterium]
MKKLLIPTNEAEALALQAVLAEHGIRALLRSFHDTAYDGIFQRQYGWGVLLVAETDFERAREIAAAWLAAAPGEKDLDWEGD